MEAEIAAEGFRQLYHLTARVLFDEVWERPWLSKRDRSRFKDDTLQCLPRVER